ncbi:ATP-binding protein [Chryseobacterium sp. PET-29]|uniref:ATP-binding protein n=1 Tax=Chryseobacterium sp. PET-29 TaxID=2983267 RepID=UPI0021E5528A|nr:ATP-binding protein [Chryseobacterium sp. PET-29]
MKNYFLFILLILLFSCNKETSNIQNNDIAISYYKKAKSLSGDSAYYYYNLAKNAYLDIKDSSGVGRSLVNMAIIQADNGDYYGSIETSLEGNRFLKNVNDSITRWSLAANYNNLGINSSYLYEFDNSIKFYKLALKYVNYPKNKYVYHNNLGDVLVTIKDYKQAINNFKIALQTKDKSDYARALNNLAKARYSENPNYNPLPELYTALKIREENDDILGQNSSYATLSNYFLDKNNKEKALDYAKKMLAVSRQKNSKEDQAQALQKIVYLDKENYLKYFKEFQILNDSLQISKSRAKNQFAVVRYDVEQKNAENQRLKANSAEKDNYILRQYFILTILVFLIIFIIILYRKRQIRLKQEKELEIKNTQLKMSKKVHDVVANGLYHMMVDVQNNPEMDKTRILNNIEKMYEESRDISHETIIEEDFSSRFVKMISSYSSPDQKVLTVGYNENIWENVSYHIQLELYYILREVLVNMKKHSNAKLASLKFEKDNTHLKIKYTDNGVGIDHLNQHKGAGIHNTENRIESIGGDITFEKNPAGGLIIQITIPIH